ncbi:LVIVD repeat-containing protein [Sphingobium herbicidovorans NBRC 16415]|uniref:LVIVD repeat-containing protein n=1 Tax=Sphingobium herbicidovorans (strain ATCC 700291 / DSM 11019 / CCUG 56400 / KCTC 2939 / LMG 18315 / NBRC 16415 / MH) TaxID=1219045 RepID=A0A086P4F6_SPHHM|nr:multiheme c-type cytochrome [Sphingobium herbicidovorans]KFG88274.1 LVIVD repeat-containing protein [Sphingobium herbicidovorans NBRC 16415]
MRPFFAFLLLILAALTVPVVILHASDAEKPVERVYAVTPPAPMSQTADQVAAKSDGCYSCHTKTDEPSMHATPAVMLGCVDCHGGNAAVRGDPSHGFDDPAYVAARDRAHVLPRYPESWHYPSSANPKRTYTLLNREAPEFVRFVNPSDYRVAREACGSCHMQTIEAAERSLMASGAMLWGGAAYNNGVVPYKNYIFGEAYTRDGKPAKIVSPGSPPGTLTAEQKARGALAELYPLPNWQVTPPGDVFRVFERGGRNIATQFPEIGLPNPTGSIQRLEEPGRPDLKQSSRGPGTGLRVAIPVLNLHKTRLNDPYMWFMGTNDQPGDYRHSGCSGCHVVYANDREPRHSLTYAPYGRDGQTATVDPTIAGKVQHEDSGHGALKGAHGDKVKPDHPIGAVKESGHPIRHTFTRAIPTAQCMNCHMHQPNIFLNSYLGYTMWDYESDASLMWPEKQKYPTAAQTHQTLERNPEGAAPKGKWSDLDFLRNVYDLNDKAKDTQFADYHGHGWNFRGVFKRDREGNLLDANGKVVANDDPEKWRKKGEPKFVQPGVNPGKSVHMMDIHAEKGLQCADCHFAQDSHGNGFIYGEVANAIEIGCKDCHGTADAYPTLLTSGPAAPPKGNNLALLRNPDGKRRFEWFYDASGRRKLIQRSIVDPSLEWEVSLVKDAVDATSPHFNAKAARAKLMSRSGAEDGSFAFGPGVAKEDRAHNDENMACFTCHLSWTTSCGGCHLPIEANWKTSLHHYEGEETRNFATYNPQVARDEMFQLGKHQTTKGNIYAPVRSTSALVLSSTNINRERIYIQQPPVSGIGFSSQAFAPHFPHTVRKTETKTCSDCHLSEKDDNNAIMSQLLLLGTNFVNFVGLNAWTGLEGGFEAIRVTEWDEPQAVIGSYLQKYAYPDYWKLHVEQNGRELKNWVRGRFFDKKASGETQAIEEFRNVVKGTRDRVGCLQLRGEYMYVAEGKGGFRVYDVASIGNKGFSEPIVSGPFSKLGHNSGVATKNATCMALPTNQPINPLRSTPELREINQEQPFLPIYSYAAVTDSVEGLIMVNIETMADGEFRNNFLKRAVTWNPDGVLNGARHIHLAGQIAYITADVGLVVVDLSDPLHPRLAAVRPMKDARASAIQFRYLWVTDAEGLKLFDVTRLTDPVAVPSATVPLADARRIYLARTYAYVAAKAEGLVIVNITNPLRPDVYAKETFGGQMNDAEDVIVGTTNASLFAYVADGRNGMKVIQLTSPASQPNFYGFSPAPKPELIAWARTPTPAVAMSKGLDRDRAVDETGGQIAVFGRIGSRPFTRTEMERLFLNAKGAPYKVSDAVDMKAWRPPLLR